MDELIFDLDTSCSAFLEYVSKASKTTVTGDLDEQLILNLVNRCFTTSEGQSATDYLKTQRDSGLYLGVLFRECMTPIQDVVFLDIDDDMPYLECLKHSRHWKCDRQEVKISPISTLELTNVSVGLASDNLKIPLLTYLKKFYSINGKPVDSYKDIHYATMTIIWSQINQLILLAPKFRKSYGRGGSSITTSQTLTPS